MPNHNNKTSKGKRHNPSPGPIMLLVITIVGFLTVLSCRSAFADELSTILQQRIPTNTQDPVGKPPLTTAPPTSLTQDAPKPGPPPSTPPPQDTPVKSTPVPPPAPQPPAPPPPLKGLTIVLDAGHGGNDTGAFREIDTAKPAVCPDYTRPITIGAQGRRTIGPVDGAKKATILTTRCEVEEKDLTLAIVYKMKPILEAYGAAVVLTRTDDHKIDLPDITAYTTNVNPDVFVAIHINSLSVKSSTLDGKQVYWYFHDCQMSAKDPSCRPGNKSDFLAKSILDQMKAELGAEQADWSQQTNDFVVDHETGQGAKYGTIPSVLVECAYITNPAKLAKLITDQYQDAQAQAIADGIVKFVSGKAPTSTKAARSKIKQRQQQRLRTSRLK